MAQLQWEMVLEITHNGLQQKKKKLLLFFFFFKRGRFWCSGLVFAGSHTRDAEGVLWPWGWGAGMVGTASPQLPPHIPCGETPQAYAKF